MSLKIWLPLDGDLRNLGCSGVEVTNNGATVDSNGKIGSCYSFDGTNDYIIGTYTPTTNISFCCWVYFPTVPAGKHIFDARNTAGNSGYQPIYINTSSIQIGGSGSSYISFSYTWTANTWYHICVTHDSMKGSFYVNGNLINSSTSAKGFDAPECNFTLGSRCNQGNYSNVKLNDVRIYDHCLSPAEVHEIAMGLVLHYKLDDPVGFTDIIQNQNTYAVYNNFSGSGTTGTLTNLSEIFYGNVVRREVMTPNDTSVNNFKTALGSHGVYGHRQTFLANTKYVFWIYYRPVSHMDVRVGGTASNINGWTEIPPVSVGGGWYRVGQYRNGTVTEDKTDNIFTSFYTPTAVSGVPITIDWASPHLLAGTTEIPSYDYPSTTISDSSGYGHNGEVLIGISQRTDSPRYNSCTHFSATNQKIKIYNFPTSGFGDSYTFAWWGRCSSFGNKMHWGFSDGIRLNGIYNGILWNTSDGSNNPLYIPGTTTQVTAPTTGVWHHYAMTGDGTNCKVYLDGEYWGIAKTYKSISGTSIYLNGWDSGTSYSNSYLSLSDFRIYCTPLLDNDIKMLYNVGMKVDNLGGIHTFNLNEKQGNIFKSEFITPFAKSGQTVGIGEIVTHNNTYAMNIRPAPFYQNLENNTSGILKGYFKANTSYIFDMWIDADSVYSNNAYRTGGFYIKYSDGTNDSTFLTLGGDGVGYQHKRLITPNNKTIDRLEIYYYASLDVFYRLDSYICPIDAFKINKTGNVDTTNIIENVTTAQINKSGSDYASEFIEL